MRPYKVKIARDFNRAANTYDQVATIQQLNATRLMSLMEKNNRISIPLHFLDLGCGTGHLTGKIIELFPDSTTTINDISPLMLEQCLKKWSGKQSLIPLLGDMDEIVMDPTQPWDFIVSNFSVHWASDPLNLIDRCARQSKALCFGILVSGTLDSWVVCKKQHKMAGPNLNYPKCQEVIDLLQSHNPRILKSEKHVYELSFHSIKDFLKYLQRLGGKGPGGEYPLKLLKSLYKDPTALTLTYHVLNIYMEK